MADYAFSRTAYTKGAEIGQVFVSGEECDFVFGYGTQILPRLGAEIYGRVEPRVVLHANERWFELGFRMDHLLSGNAAAGWTDAGNYFRIEPEWSPDLLNWSMGKFIPAPAPVIDNGDGTWTYWSRAIHPVDSAVKTGTLRAASSTAQQGINGNILPDARNNPFTALTINNAAVALPNFPYTMPGDAAVLQAAIRAAGWPLATVTATTSTAWEIIIPGVSNTAFNAVNKIWWPVYQNGVDFLGNPTYLDGAIFYADYANAAGVFIYPKAFGRLKISAGTRYSPWT